MIQRRCSAQTIWRLAVGLLVAFGLAAGVHSFAQSGRGTLTGSVKDTNGAVLQGATLTLTGTNTGSRYEAKCQRGGTIHLPRASPGNLYPRSDFAWI